MAIVPKAAGREFRPRLDAATGEQILEMANDR
jgi:hypothetical protein